MAAPGGGPAAESAAAATLPVATTGPAKKSAKALCDTTVAKNEARCFGMVMERDGLVPMSPAPTGLSPADVRDAYKLPDNGGAGRTIAAVVAYDAPTAEADLAHYRETFGLAPLAEGQFKKVDQRGGTDYPSADAGWAGEAALDVDAITAVAPNANIVLVVADSANFTDLGEAVNQAVAQGAEVVNNSYGTGYDSSPGSGEDDSLLPVDAQYYDHPGVAIVASSGDDDYGVSFPASSNHVTSVGGTSLVKDTSSRGWTESVWHNSYGGPGSGCSIVFDKVPGQPDTGCAKRTVADVSAVADPETGLSVYYTYAGGEWGQYGGTSLSAPLISGIYALAGKPAADSYPNAYPYAKQDAFFDVTAGMNGTCTPSYLCTAGAGFDGPTGIGTPNGISAFGSGPHGEVTGTVTDKASGDPLAGVKVEIAEKGSATTADDGTYSLSVEPGSYSVTFSAYGYKSVTKTGVVVTDGGSIAVNVALATVPSRSVTGQVKDGSGHGYPLYSMITISGAPGGPIYTDPYDGTYAVDLPQGGTYDFTFTPVVPGYLPVTKSVKVGGADRSVNVSMKVDTSLDTVTGYTFQEAGSTETFDGTSAPAGWSVTDLKDPGWTFTDIKKRGNLTGGDGGFAIIDSDASGSGKNQDSYLNSPGYDLSAATGPTLEFDSYFRPFTTSNGTVEVSTDGGTTWSQVFTVNSKAQSGHVKVGLGDAAKTANVEVRFHYTGSFAYYWEVDNVFVGNRKAVPTHGGLLSGVVNDANTNGFVKGAKVTSDTDPAITATTGPTGDPAVGDGYYWLFSTITGAQPFTAGKSAYADAKASPNVRANLSTRQDFTLKAGQIAVTPTEINKTIRWGGSKRQALTVTNTGGLPATVKVGEGSGGFVMASRTGAPAQTVKTTVFNGSAKARAAKLGRVATSGAKAVVPNQVGPSADAWQNVANYPVAIMDSSAAFGNGKVYSVGGYNGSDDTNDLYAYDPQGASWEKLASATDKREAGAGAFIGNQFIWTGGWGPTGAPDGKTELYDPAGNSWSLGAVNPKPHSAAGRAVVGGKLYLVGGCATSSCGSTDVQVYDASADSWSSVANYPEAVAWQACGAIGEKIYCAGGNTDAATSAKTYVYDPATDAWSPAADLPVDLWASFSVAANGQLLVSGGVTANSSAITNIGYAYDPAADAWTPLPNLNSALYRGNGALGFYAVGGNPGPSGAPPVSTVQLLAGYDQGGSTDVPWLSETPTELTLAPGASAQVTVVLDAADPSIAQPGVYTAAVTLGTDTPYSVPNIAVNMTVKPPNTWGKIAGTVTSTDKSGAPVPVPGATVELDSWAASYTLTTEADGSYAIWIDKRNNPVTAIVAKDGFKPQTATIKVVAGATVTKNWVLIKK
ncbi:carboxypeptidase regulatory-like domain-containing protein [Nakamurella lactea]|uniref:carboxypeptidase regulatory-like domain-containing protein n=1 Tax=Nakamurella lactea TaxID=459515 RepID=UPI001B7FA3C9|nr:carboxypeptidase regulatory-like domain-containing protein [Nakamurella lactea]